MNTFIYQQPNAYDYIQADVENNFYYYLNKKKTDIKTIVIVGAHYGNEIDRLLHNYPNVFIHAIEAHPRHFNILSSRYSRNPRIKLYNIAISDSAGTANFFELNNDNGGCGSLLEFQADKNGDKLSIKEVITVPTTTLDLLLPDLQIDLLWVDVQGAELKVLKGTTLNRCTSLFLEVNTGSYTNIRHKEPYKGQCFLKDLTDYLSSNFRLYSIGLDNVDHSGQGNSFWVPIT